VSYAGASQHDAGVVYAAFDNHKRGDFKPYLLRSTDRGRTWTSIAADLPEGNVVYTLAEDHVDANLLFAGTEFGLYVSVDRGGKWIRLKGNLPTISVRDLMIRSARTTSRWRRSGAASTSSTTTRRCAGSSARRSRRTRSCSRSARARLHRAVAARRPRQGDQATRSSSPQPPFGATFTYYLKDELRTLQERRHEAEKAARRRTGSRLPDQRPAAREAREEKPAIIVTVSDAEGNVVRRLTGPRPGVPPGRLGPALPPSNPTRVEPPREEPAPWDLRERGPLAMPAVTACRWPGGSAARSASWSRAAFRGRGVGRATLKAPDATAQLASSRRPRAAARGARLRRGRQGDQGPPDQDQEGDRRHAGRDAELAARVRELERRLADLDVRLRGDQVLAERNEPTPNSIVDRVQASSLPTGRPPRRRPRR